MNTLHITGFEDWAVLTSTGPIPNPSRLLVDRIRGDGNLQRELAKCAGVGDVQTALLPVPNGHDLLVIQHITKSALSQLYAKVNPEDVMLSLGQGSLMQRGPVLEGFFTNTLQNQGIDSIAFDTQQPKDTVIKARGDLEALTSQMRESYPEISYGTNAGRYVCNMVGYLNDQCLGAHSLFVHLPGLPNDATLVENFWKVNRTILRGSGLTSPKNLAHPSVEENVAFVRTLLTIWKSFR